MTIVKKKHVLVIVFSSLIISVVFLSTLVGYSIYLQWKEDSFALRYRDAIYRLTAQIFRNNIAVGNVTVKIGEDRPFKGMPMMEGSLKNNSSKTVTSILIEVSFSRPDGTVVYKDSFYPLGAYKYTHPALLTGMENTRNVLLPGEGISFRHLMRNCPREVVSQLSTRSKFAKSGSEDKLRFEYSINGMRVL